MRNFLHNIIDWFFKYCYYISSFLLVVLSVIDISDLNDFTMSFASDDKFPIGKVLYYFVVIFSIIFGLAGIQNAKNISDLEIDNTDKAGKIIDLENSFSSVVKERNELFNSYLMLLVKNLNFAHNERISVYKIYENNFILIGRSSNNPNLVLHGRSNYPLNEGFIGKAWAEGEFYIHDLPDPNLRNGDTYYQRVNAICNIPRNVIQGMTMLSRTFYIYRINGFEGHPKAIIVIESQNPNAFTKEEVIEKLNGVKQPLIMFVEKNSGLNLQNSNNIGL